MIRSVPLDEEQYLFIEDLGKEFIRAGQQEKGTRLLAIALAWRVSPVARFECEVDESAGMADVVELEGYSRKVPCA